MLTAMGLSLDRFCPYHEHTCHSGPSPKVCTPLPGYSAGCYVRICPVRTSHWLSWQ